MQQPTTAPTAPTTSPVTRLGLIAIVLTAVILVHAGLFAWALTSGEPTVGRPIESRTITAELLAAAPQPVAPEAASQRAPLEPVVPTVHARASARKRPTARTAPPAAVSRPERAVPSPGAPSTPDLAAPAPSATASAPTIERPTLELRVPKSVSHVACTLATPDYPDISKRHGETGTAIVRFVVGLSGSIENIQLQKSSGYPRLDEAALDAIHASVCQPYRENGEAIRAAYSQPFVFGLTD